jgi:L-2-hydroxyglutarate oxidase
MYDFVIIGGGIVGVSTALALIKSEPTKKILLLEKERALGSHQTGHNSGVVHAGVYYEPGSLKAKFCKQGLKETIEFCNEHKISYEQCGKLLVATCEKDVARMNSLLKRCQENEIEASLLNQDEMQLIEPNIKGVGAILVKSTAIVDYQSVAQKMAQQYEYLGGEYLLNTAVIKLDEDSNSITITTNTESMETRYLISCAGLMSDRIVGMLGIKTDFRVIPFRGEYYRLPMHKNNIIKHLIYPIPDPDLPFLGIHLTRIIDGSITVGPNAVLGFKREGYAKFNFNFKDVIDMLSFGGFYRLLRLNLKSGFNEILNSLNKNNYLKQVQKYCPSITIEDLIPYPAGVRAQAVSKDGKLVDDFLFTNSKRSIHVCNAPSPAATSSIPIGKYIASKAAIELNKLY